MKKQHLLISLLAATALAQQDAPLGPTETRHPQDDTRALLTGQRVMQVFDFEERDIHLEPLPMYWQKSPASPGFPHYATGRLDDSFAHSGRYSFELLPDGGSVGFRYHARRIPVRPGSDFQITAYVHLQSAPHCRARLSCTFSDRRGELIPDSTHTSNLAGPQHHDLDGWARLDVLLPGNYPDARYLTIGVWLLQEEQWNTDANLHNPIFRTDIDAAAWFDDIAIYQLPRLRLTTDQPGNVFDAHQTPNLNIEIEHVNSLDYQIRLDVEDAQGRNVHHEAWLLTGIAEQRRVRSVSLPNLTAGLYHARLEIVSSGHVVARRNLSFAHLAPRTADPATSGAQFGILALTENIGDWDTILALTQLANARLIKLPVWRRHPEETGAIFSTPDFDQKLLKLQQSNIQIMAAFSEVPDSLAAKTNFGRTTLLDILSKDADIWRPQLASVLAQYARQVPYWQVGADDPRQGASWDPRIRAVLASLHHEFAQLVSETVLAVPVNALYEVSSEQLGTTHAALVLPNTIAPEQIPDYIDDCRQRGLQTIWTTIEPLPANQYHRQQRLIDFAKRLAYARKGNAQAVFIEHPWTMRSANGEPCVEPTELLPIFRTIADQLGAADFRGEFAISSDVHAMIFDRDGFGCLLLFRRPQRPGLLTTTDDSDGTVQLFLGDEPTLIDLFGNSRSLPSPNGIATFELDEWPVLIDNVNTRLAQFRAGLQLVPRQLDATIMPQQTTLTFENPFKVAVSGRIRLLRTQPNQANWTIDPSVCEFSLRPGQTFEQPITLRFPRNEIGGPKKLDTFIIVDGDRPYQFHHPLGFDIDLAGVDISVFARRAGTRDLLLQQIVTNTSDQELNLLSFVDLPDADRLERAIPQLSPGATITKNYRIPDAAQWVGQYLRFGLYDPQGTRRLNRLLEIN